MIIKIDVIKWDKETGLIPVVVQDHMSKDVLMQAFVNKEALNTTIDTGYAHYFSRSRNRLWMKGETSGNVQRIIEISIDCDGDALLYLVEQKGVACHTGNRSCFYRKVWRIDV
jgi:phosphoribosyl-AMP cyclohydrolase